MTEIHDELWMYIFNLCSSLSRLKQVCKKFKSLICELENQDHVYPHGGITVKQLMMKLKNYPEDAIVYTENFHTTTLKSTLTSKYYMKRLPSYHFTKITTETIYGVSQWSNMKLPYISHQSETPSENFILFLKDPNDPDNESFIDSQNSSTYHTDHVPFKILVRDGVCLK